MVDRARTPRERVAFPRAPARSNATRSDRAIDSGPGTQAWVTCSTGAPMRRRPYPRPGGKVTCVGDGCPRTLDREAKKITHVPFQSNQHSLLPQRKNDHRDIPSLSHPLTRRRRCEKRAARECSPRENMITGYVALDASAPLLRSAE